MTDSQPARGCDLNALTITNLRNRMEASAKAASYHQRGFVDVPIQELERLLDMVAKSGKVTDAMVRAASESCAKDDEGEFPPLCDLINYSGENKTRTVVRAALVAALQVKP